MTELKSLFNRAFKHAFEKRKIFFLGSLLLLLGLFFLFCRAVGLVSGKWGTWSLSVFAFFLCVIPLLAAQVVLVNAYMKEREHLSFSLREIFAEKWEEMGTAAMLGVPLLLGAVLATFLMGMFILFVKIPLVGSFFSVVLAFGPYLLVISTCVLGILAALLFFFGIPALCLKEESTLQDLLSSLTQKLSSDVFSTFFLLLMGLLPLFLLSWMLFSAARWAAWLYSVSEYPFVGFFQSFFLLLPFVVFFTPALLFFFNFATEVSLHQKTRL